MQIVVAGIGALGCLLGARLSDVAEVTLFGHWPEQLAAVKNDGLWLEHPDGKRSHYPLKVTSDATSLTATDLLLVAVKSYQTSSLASILSAVLPPSALVITLQNGLNNRLRLTKALGSGRIALGITSEGATVLGPGHIRHAGSGTTHLGRDSQLVADIAVPLDEVAVLFNAAGFRTDVVTNAEGLVWGKLAVSAAINPITALLRVPNGFLLEYKVLVQMMMEAAAEVVAVAQKLGVDIPTATPVDQALTVARDTALNRSSMLQDILRGSPTEIEFICGAVAQLGEQVGVATPINTRLFKLVRLLESGQIMPLREGDVDGFIRLMDQE